MAGRFGWMAAVAAVFVVALGAAAQQPFTDTRDGKVYKTVTIGGKRWFAENLNYAAKGSKCGGIGDKPEYCKKYGRLYDWETAVKACPAGWRLATIDDWGALMNYVGEEETGKKLKSTSGWGDVGKKNGNGTDNYGFAALPGGCAGGDDKSKCFSSFYGEIGNVIGGYGWWWSASESWPHALYLTMTYSSEDVSRSINAKSTLMSVRCVCEE